MEKFRGFSSYHESKGKKQQKKDWKWKNVRRFRIAILLRECVIDEENDDR